MNKKLTEEFFQRDVLEVAPALVGKLIVRRLADGTLISERIAETEAYRGEEDKACHASKGRTNRTELLYADGGHFYVYLCYGMHWLTNVVTGRNGTPQGVLLRAGYTHNGPAKLSKYLSIDGGFHGRRISETDVLWFEDDGFSPKIRVAPRVGIDYAGDYWKNIEWRFIAEEE